MWFVSIILSADILLFTADKVNPRTQGWFILCVSLIGAVICLVALRVLRNESINFQLAAFRFIAQHNFCFAEPPLPQVDPAAANKPLGRLVAETLRGRATIRDAFQFLFVVFFIVFLL